MHQPATPLNKQDAVTSPDDRAEQRKFVRKVVSVAIVAITVLITLYVWGTIERHPRTDDAAARGDPSRRWRVGHRGPFWVRSGNRVGPRG